MKLSKRSKRLKRIKKGVSRAFLDFVKTLPCIACARRPPSDPDHITTRGAGGQDVAVNVWPLCREHHVERHAQGLKHMIDKYPSCKDWLERAGRQDVFDRIERKLK